MKMQRSNTRFWTEKRLMRWESAQCAEHCERSNKGTEAQLSMRHIATCSREPLLLAFAPSIIWASYAKVLVRRACRHLKMTYPHRSRSNHAESRSRSSMRAIRQFAYGKAFNWTPNKGTTSQGHQFTRLHAVRQICVGKFIYEAWCLLHLHMRSAILPLK